MTEPDSITYSGGIEYLEFALDEHSRSLAQLRLNMDSFVPLPMDAFAQSRQAEIDRVKSINPPENANYIEEMVNRNFDIGYSPEWQFLRRFEREFPAAKVMITLTSHALCEAIINANLALGLHKLRKSKLFPALEGCSLLDKWTLAPLAFHEHFKFSKSGLLFKTLKDLIKIRNTLTHQKLHLRGEDGATVLKGNNAGAISMGPNDRLQLQRFVALPYALQSHLLLQLDGTALSRFLRNILKSENKSLMCGEQMLNYVT